MSGRSTILTRVVTVNGKEIERESYPVTDKRDVAFVEYDFTATMLHSKVLIRFEFDPPLDVPRAKGVASS